MAAGTLIPASPARAAGWTELAELASCPPDGDPVAVQLTEHVVVTEVLAVTCDATVDLNGFTLDVSRVEITAPAALTITDTSEDADGHLVADDAQVEQPGIRVPFGARLTITGGRVTAVGGDDAPGIGQYQLDRAPGQIVITGGTVTATGGASAAGIGGGSSTIGADLTIENGTVTATGGWQGAGIGGGNSAPGGTTVVEGGVVIAQAGGQAAAIGGGDGGDGGHTTIKGGTVEAIGPAERGAGIGGGYGRNGGTTIIEGGNVTAVAGEDAAGIGSGDGGSTGGIITISGGIVDAQATDDAAGIGGGDGGEGGTITITGGHVTARGAELGAGIGGGDYGASGTITITGGTIEAYGGEHAAAIGGGSGGAGGTVAITAATVAVTAGLGAPAIGPGCLGAPGGPITIGEGAHVTATAAVGDIDCVPTGVLNLSATERPALTVAGTLRLIGGAPVELPGPTGGDDPTVLVEETGLITGPEADPTTGPVLRGDGWIQNDGIIAFQETLVQVDVQHHNYVLTFDPADALPTPIRVFAPTFTSAYRGDPPTTASGNWWSVDGENRWWSADETLSADLTLVELDGADHEPVIVSLDSNAQAGTEVPITVTVVDRFGNIVPDPPNIEVVSDNPDDSITGAVPTFTFVGTRAGVRTITVTNPENGQFQTFEFTVTPGEPAVLTLTPSDTTVDEGASVTFSVAAFDAYGNPVDASGVELTSSVATDEIDGLIVTFPTASPHVITGTLGAASASVTIEVIPPATTTTTVPPTTTTTLPPTTTTLPVSTTVAPDLPATGGSSLPIALAALIVLAAGTATVTLTRRPR